MIFYFNEGLQEKQRYRVFYVDPVAMLIKTADENSIRLALVEKKVQNL